MKGKCGDKNGTNVVTSPCETFTDLACASSRLWSVMFMICCSISPMSCLRFSFPSPVCCCDDRDDGSDAADGMLYPVGPT